MTDTAGRKPPVMPLGRELDALVAEKVMGWKRLGDASPHSRWRGLEWVKPDGSLSVTLTFSVEWDAMRLVVERLVALHWEVNTVSANGCLPECYLVPDSENHYCGTLNEHGDTVPHAVALAALKAVEATHA